MFGFHTQLYDGQAIRLAPIDHKKDAEVESRWTHDGEYSRLMELGPVYPLSATQVKKRYEALEKKIDEDKNLFYFTIRDREDDRLVGKAVLEWISWSNGNAWLRLGIGAPGDRRKGLGSEALSMLLRFAFTELNLFRVSAVVPEYNEGAMRLFRKFGFMEETRRRQALPRDGRRWDLVCFGLLQSEWREQTVAGGDA